jgi:hypothetical protein
MFDLIPFVNTVKEGGFLTVDAPRLYGDIAWSEDIWVGQLEPFDFLSHVS